VFSRITSTCHESWPRNEIKTMTRAPDINSRFAVQLPRHEPGNDSAVLALLSELEISLRASQQALLAGDVLALEQLTEEQRVLRQKLSLTWPFSGFHKTSRQSDPNDVPRLARFGKSAWRVLYEGRVQLALLHHAQRHVRAIACCAAGSQATYHPPSTLTAVRENLPLGQEA
jgi:hypothetical protein